MTKPYTIKRISHDISITGKGDDNLWQTAHVLEDFACPWPELEFNSGSCSDPTLREAIPNIQFRALNSERFSYFFFRVDDAQTQDKLDILKSLNTVDCDRVELFLAQNLELKPYYPLEIDPLARILDAEANHYRDINFDWSWPAQDIQIASATDEQGYSVEFALSNDSLERLQLKQQDAQGEYLLAGLFCAYYPYVAQLNERKPQWISWVKPDSEKPDFHIPSAFAHLYYE